MKILHLCFCLIPIDKYKMNNRFNFSRLHSFMFLHWIRLPATLALNYAPLLHSQPAIYTIETPRIWLVLHQSLLNWRHQDASVSHISTTYKLSMATLLKAQCQTGDAYWWLKHNILKKYLQMFDTKIFNATTPTTERIPCIYPLRIKKSNKKFNEVLGEKHL